MCSEAAHEDAIEAEVDRTGVADGRAHPGTTGSYELPQRFDYELDTWIGRAADGDPEAAQAVLARLVLAVDRSEQVDRRVLAFLANAFRQMLAEGSRDPRHSLGLLRRRAGNPGLTTEKRPLTADDREERQQLAYELVARGLTDREVIDRLVEEPIVPARLLGRDTARNMVRQATTGLQRRRDELRANGTLDYDIAKWLSMEFGISGRMIEDVLAQVDKRHALRKN